MVQGELPTIDTGGEISSPNVPSGTGGTKSKSKSKYCNAALAVPPVAKGIRQQVPFESHFHDNVK